jgi:hypothetical protein
MFSLVYRSVSKPEFRLDLIQEMLFRAKENNHKLGITGCLLYYHGEFIQYLEGNQYRVLTLFDRIKEDPRHTQVELLGYEEREKRAFASWDMAYENFYGENTQITHLKLMVSEFLERQPVSEEHNPSSSVFWHTVSRILEGKSAV